MLENFFPVMQFSIAGVFIYGMYEIKYFPYTFFLTYFSFLASVLYMVYHVEEIIQHPKMEEMVERIRYNLRDIPRVDYKEVSDDESKEEEEDYGEEDSEEEEDYGEEDSEEEVDSEEVVQSPIESESEDMPRKRRDRNPMERIMEVMT